MSIYSSKTFEALAQQFNHSGLSMSLSKILALFLVSEEKVIAMKEVVEQLGIAKSTASVEVARLEQMRLIEKTINPNQRGHYYRLKPNLWSSALAKKQAELSALQSILHSAEKEFRSVPDSLKELQQYVAFMEQEWPQLIAKWQQYKRDNDVQ
ncbi:GbsR/MarR family transcriptional regulator [Legionella sp. W05-934-2]|jgi:DNA-binding transcriptional regulator GbsR (MarR family)|uniref:GbsR/MarR family transcriptional regulator n=1 Tax=Legionella sp. W05-934-2 TaxID=1198649 RepID=UPI003462BF16